MEKFTIKNWRTGEIIHEGEAESFKEFVEKNKGNLKDAYLKDAYLKCADLEDANLTDANLRNAYLGGANLTNANLRNAYLGGANLRNANLEGANFENCTIPIYSKRDISIKLLDSNIEKQDINKIKINIGCKIKTIAEWDAWFSSDEEYETKRGTFEFRQIEAMYEAYKAYVVKLWS